MGMGIGPISKPSIFEVVGGAEDTHFNPVSAAEIDRIVAPVLGIDVDDVKREVPCMGRRLDLLATADTHRVAIELQYGEADPSHLGRLVGWYAPHVAATDMILVAESFPTVVVDAVRESRVPNLALLRVVPGWNQDGTSGLDFELVISNITPVLGHSAEADEKNLAMRDSIARLGKALTEHGLKDSNARGYVRLFPIRGEVWANVLVRAKRVVVTVGSAQVIDAESAVKTLPDEWGAHGNGLYLTVSDDVDAYALRPEAEGVIAAEISEMRRNINEVIDAVAATIRQEDDLDTG
jgi:hypothetical protein